MYHHFTLKIFLRSAHTVYLCVLCGSQNKQRLFPYTTLTDWFLSVESEGWICPSQCCTCKVSEHAVTDCRQGALLQMGGGGIGRATKISPQLKEVTEYEIYGGQLNVTFDSESVI